jgi:oxygen-dependent protoporphyrinogen oxidase
MASVFIETVVIGGGLAGLVTARELKKHGRSVVVLEKGERVGGVVRSERADGYLLELGPNTVQSQQEVLELIHELGLDAQMQIASARTPRYVQMNRRLHAVPLSPLGLITTGLLSWSGKIRLLREPWIKSGAPSMESLHDFAERRLGREATRRLLAPFVAGVWASDIAALSASATFPKLVAWEQEHGSLLRGAIKNKPAKKTPRGLIGFKNGMGTLINGLAAALGPDIRLKTSPTKIFRAGSKWRVETSGGDSWDSGHVVLAAPAFSLAPLLRETAPQASAALDLISYSPLTIVHMGFKPGELERRQKGFGYLTLPSEKPDILGCIWSSDIFPERAPDGHTLLTVFVGGSLNPGMAEMPDRPLEDHVINALNTVMDVRRRPSFLRVTRHANAIPQYGLEHPRRMEILSDAERGNPGLHFIGNIRGGVSVRDVIRFSKTCASRLLSEDTRRTP